MQTKLANNIGLINRTGNIVLGTDNIITMMKKSKVKLVLVSSTASINTQKLIQDKADTYNIDVVGVTILDEVDFSKALGRKNVVVIGIKGNEFKKMIMNSIKE